MLDVYADRVYVFPLCVRHSGRGWRGNSGGLLAGQVVKAPNRRVPDRINTMQVKPKDCPKFDACSVPICPLDDNWRNSWHLSGEPVCLYLRQAAKQACIPQHMTEKVSKAYLEILSSLSPNFNDIKRRLSRAALSPSKIDTARGFK